MVSPFVADVICAAMMIGTTVGAVLLWFSIRKADHGGEMHAHDDGTVHEHWRGDRVHEHRPSRGGLTRVQRSRQAR